MTIKNKSLKEMFKDSEISKEIQEQINDIFEAAVVDATKDKEEEIKAKAEADKEKEIAEAIEAKFKELEEATEKYKDEVVAEQAEKFLELAIDEWVEENKVAIQESIIVEMANEFLQSATKLVETTGFKIDKKDIDINKELKETVENLKTDQNKLIESNIELKKQNADFIKESKSKEVFSKLELTESQVEKVSGAVSKLSYKSDEQFETAVKSIVESYFPKVDESDKDKTPEKINEKEEDKNEYYYKMYNQL